MSLLRTDKPDPVDQRRGDGPAPDHRQGPRRAHGGPGLRRPGHRARARLVSRACSGTGSPAGPARTGSTGRRRFPAELRSARSGDRRGTEPSVEPALPPQPAGGGRRCRPSRPPPRRPAGRRCGRRWAGWPGPGRGTRAATPTSACGPAPTPGYAWLAGFLTTAAAEGTAAGDRAAAGGAVRAAEPPGAQLRHRRACSARVWRPAAGWTRRPRASASGCAPGSWTSRRNCCHDPRGPCAGPRHYDHGALAAPAARPS